MHDRAAGQPVVEVAEHDEQRIAHRLEIVEDLPHLELPLAYAKTQMGCEHVHLHPFDLHRCRKRATLLPPFDRQVDTMHVDDGMPRQQRIAEALRHGLPRGTERALIAIQGCEHDGLACLERDAGRIGEFLQCDDVCIQLADN